MRMKLSGALTSRLPAGRGASKFIGRCWRPQLMRRPLGGRGGELRAPSHALLPGAFPVWRGARVGNDSCELWLNGVSMYGAFVAPEESRQLA
jgi:hypothetical protein